MTQRDKYATKKPIHYLSKKDHISIRYQKLFVHVCTLCAELFLGTVNESLRWCVIHERWHDIAVCNYQLSSLCETNYYDNMSM